jgi:isocitrate dehydrogenase
LVESGKMTKDLAVCIHGDAMKEEHFLTTEDFLDAIDAELRKRMTA